MHTHPSPILNTGERYAGVVLDATGNIKHHLILLPDRPNCPVNWQTAMAWAASVGGQLPDRQEKSLLCANSMAHLECATWHWLSETHEDNRDYAWFCNFERGTQSFFRKIDKGAAVAVRRLMFEAEGGAA